MSDLSDFEDEYFDIVVNPVSNLFVKDVNLVWNEISRVLKNRGILISGLQIRYYGFLMTIKSKRVYLMLNILYLHQH